MDSAISKERALSIQYSPIHIQTKHFSCRDLLRELGKKNQWKSVGSTVLSPLRYLSPFGNCPPKNPWWFFLLKSWLVMYSRFCLNDSSMALSVRIASRISVGFSECTSLRAAQIQELIFPCSSSTTSAKSPWATILLFRHSLRCSFPGKRSTVCPAPRLQNVAQQGRMPKVGWGLISCWSYSLKQPRALQCAFLMLKACSFAKENESFSFPQCNNIV